MEDDLINDIVRTCLAVDVKAARIYARFSLSSASPDLKAFWDRMAGEERMHARFWKELSNLADRGMVPQVFDSPGQVLDDLRKIDATAGELLEQSTQQPDIAGQFLIAYRLEFYTLHPAFESLFQSAMMLEGIRFNPGEEYEEHLDRFIEAMITFGRGAPAIELLGESLQRLWKNNRVLARQSSLDELTGVLNRRGFFNLVKPFVQLAWRNQYTVGVMMIDVDRFKLVNDRYGHQAGDKVLAEVARILRQSLRPYDMLGRYGGEEFIVFVTPFSPGNLMAMANKLRARVEEITGNDIPVTVSIGAASGRIEKDAETELRSLIATADRALYTAKKEGRNRVVCASAEATGEARVA